MKENKIFRSGFISVTGRPNVGKSTLVNSIVGEKVSAVSDKPNTTRNRITGIKNLSSAQMIFVDTPGIHKARDRLGKTMVKTAYTVLGDCDLVLLVIDVLNPFTRGDELILSHINKPSVVVLNKIDRVRKQEILRVMETSRRFSEQIAEIVPVSALNNDGIDYLVEVLERYLPAGTKYFPDDMYTDQTERFLVSEIIREKIFNLTREEIPYKTAVTIEDFSEVEEKKLLNIHAVVYVERKNHKSIVIGRDGIMLKRVGSQAREELERIFGFRVYLDLWVKVKEKWTDRDSNIREFGYSRN